jgi:hypothetical protein
MGESGHVLIHITTQAFDWRDQRKPVKTPARANSLKAKNLNLNLLNMKEC